MEGWEENPNGWPQGGEGSPEESLSRGKDGTSEGRECLQWAGRIQCPFPTKGRGKESNASHSRGGCKPSLWGILSMCYPHPSPPKTPGECKNPRAISSNGDLAHPHLTTRQSSSKNEQHPGEETPGKEELWHLLPVRGRRGSRLNPVCVCSQERGRAGGRHGTLQAHPCCQQLRCPRGAEGRGSRRRHSQGTCQAVFTREAFPWLRFPRGFVREGSRAFPAAAPGLPEPPCRAAAPIPASTPIQVPGTP